MTELRHPHLPATLSANAPRFDHGGAVGPVDPASTPRFAGPSTFALLPQIQEVPHADLAVVGVAWDSGVSFRPGARFGPDHIRQSSRLIRPYNPATELFPFAGRQVVDAGDIAISPVEIMSAIDTLSATASEFARAGTSLVTLGGDHTISLPLLRAAADAHGPVALLHFDAHLDTWEDFFGHRYTHGTPFRRAVEEGLLDTEAVCHVGTRGPVYGQKDLEGDRRLGFGILTTDDVWRRGIDEVVQVLRERIGDRPVYVSVDIDVLDPAFAPGTGTLESGGLQARELLAILRGLQGLRVVGADLVEVAPAYDHAQITGVAAAHIAFDLIGLIGEPLREPAA